MSCVDLCLSILCRRWNFHPQRSHSNGLAMLLLCTDKYITITFNHHICLLFLKAWRLIGGAQLCIIYIIKKFYILDGILVTYACNNISINVTFIITKTAFLMNIFLSIIFMSILYFSYSTKPFKGTRRKVPSQNATIPLVLLV